VAALAHAAAAAVTMSTRFKGVTMMTTTSRKQTSFFPVLTGQDSIDVSWQAQNCQSARSGLGCLSEETKLGPIYIYMHISATCRVFFYEVGKLTIDGSRLLPTSYYPACLRRLGRYLDCLGSFLARLVRPLRLCFCFDRH